MFRTRRSALVVVVLGVASVRAAAYERPIVKASVGDSTDRGTAYSYRIFNPGSVEVRGWTLGLDFGAQTAMLPIVPIFASAPTGWAQQIIRTEESLIWEVDWSGPDSPVVPGGTLSGFVVRVAQRDAAYESGPVTIYVSDGWIVSSVQLEAPVVPVLSCVEEDPVTHALTARFQYENRNSYDVPLQVGPANRFVPGAENRGQPTTFLAPPSRPEQVRVAFAAGESVTWELGASSVSATSQSPRCTP